MKALHLSVKGLVNSFRLPDHHTFHKTLPLPPKTTIAGLIGAALGVGPDEVNDQWLANNRFSVAIRGQYQGLFKDLWQYRKYTNKHIAAYEKGEEDFPWYTGVTTRELLYALDCQIYIQTTDEPDLTLLQAAFQNPAWALSLGRDDELVHIREVGIIDLEHFSGQPSWSNTVLPFDIFERGAKLDTIFLAKQAATDLLVYAPKVVKLPDLFDYNEKGERHPKGYRNYTFIGDMPVKINETMSYYAPANTIKNHEQPLAFI